MIQRAHRERVGRLGPEGTAGQHSLLSWTGRVTKDMGRPDRKRKQQRRQFKPPRLKDLEADITTWSHGAGWAQKPELSWTISRLSALLWVWWDIGNCRNYALTLIVGLIILVSAVSLKYTEHIFLVLHTQIIVKVCLLVLVSFIFLLLYLVCYEKKPEDIVLHTASMFVCCSLLPIDCL